MKKLRLILSLVIVFITAQLTAQELPQAINFQAIARDANGQALANTNIMIQLSVIDGTAEGPVVYREIRALQTNAYGGFNFQVGREPNIADGNFSEIDWANGRKFLKVDYDPTNSMSFNLTLGTIEFVSVPYAFVAGNVSYINLDGVEDGNILVYNAAAGRFEPQEANAGGIVVETDPTVPAWAKEDEKPTYDYSEILNTPEIPEMPENVSAFNNDAGYITSADIPAIPEVPENVSAFNNDAGYITSYTETQNLANVVAIGNSANAQIKNVTNPTDAQDAATKAYVDGRIAALNALIAQLESRLDSVANETSTSLSTPWVETSDEINYSYLTAICGGNVVYSGLSTVIACGVCWSTNPDPTVEDSHTSDGNGLGSFTSIMNGLSPNTTYYVRAYATNSMGTSYGAQKTFTTLEQAVAGGINAKYSISSSTQVYFSMGNLQYQASTNTWRFAENQWDYVGNDNSNISSSYSGWIDLLGWGTGNNPTNNVTINSYYGTYNEWGNNPISNGGNTANQWRTLTQSEWSYLLFTRATTSGIRYAKANVNGVNGLIILPDVWSTSNYTLSNTNTTNSAYTSNTITLVDWINKLEANGAVFLPTAGSRDGTSVDSVGSDGYYWSSSPNGSSNAYRLGFYSSNLGMEYYDRYYGRSVRLIQVANN